MLLPGLNWSGSYSRFEIWAYDLGSSVVIIVDFDAFDVKVVLRSKSFYSLFC